MNEDLCSRLRHCCISTVTFYVTLEGADKHFSRDKIRMLNRIARFQPYTDNLPKFRIVVVTDNFDIR